MWRDHCETQGVEISDEKGWNDIDNVKKLPFSVEWNYNGLCEYLQRKPERKYTMKGCNFSKDFTTFRIGNIYWYK